MNLLKRTGVLEKLYQSIKNYSPLISTVRQLTTFPRNRENLQQRFLKHLNNFDVSNKNDKKTEDPKLHLQDLKLPDINNNTSSILALTDDLDYDSLVTFLQNFSNEQTLKCARTLSQIDINCCKLLGRLSTSEILHLLHLFVKVKDLTTMRFYKRALFTLQQRLKRNVLDVREILQFLFFTSMGKKASRAKVEALIQFLPPLKDLAVMDRCIVARSTFICSVKLKSSDARTLEETLDQYPSQFIKDPALLVTLCKAVRYRGPSPNLSLTNLSTEILQDKRKFTTIAAAHVISLYTEAGHQNVKVMSKLFADSMWQLMKQRMGARTALPNRVKDIDRLLWASSRLAYDLKESDTLEIISYINREHSEFTKYPFYLVNMLLSLWILDLKLINVIDNCLATGVFQIVNKERSLWKRIGRLQLLLSCIRIESPEIILPDELTKPYGIGLKIGTSVGNLHKIVNELRRSLDIESVTIDCPVSGIYIAGVSLKSKTTLIHVDVLDETTCFVGTNVLNGLARLKVRLLPKIGYTSILINADRVNDREFISSSIRKSIGDENCG